MQIVGKLNAEVLQAIRVSDILAFEGDSKVTFFNGNYHEYEADKVKRLGEQGAQPRRIRYKPLKA